MVAELIVTVILIYYSFFPLLLFTSFFPISFSFHPPLLFLFLFPLQTPSPPFPSPSTPLPPHFFSSISTHSNTPSLPLLLLSNFPPSSANAHPSIQDFNKWLPLHYACNNGHVECVRTIISHLLGLHGLKLALDLATKKGYREIVAILRDAHTKLVSPISCFLSHVGCDNFRTFIAQLRELSPFTITPHLPSSFHSH